MKARLDSAPASETSAPLPFRPEVTPHSRMLEREFLVKQAYDNKGDGCLPISY